MSNVYYTLGNLTHNGQKYAAGEAVYDLSDDQAARLVREGVVSINAPAEPEGPAGRERVLTDEERARQKAVADGRKGGVDEVRVGGSPLESGEASDFNGVTDEPPVVPTPGGFLGRVFGGAAKREDVTPGAHQTAPAAPSNPEATPAAPTPEAPTDAQGAGGTAPQDPERDPSAGL